MNEKYHLIIIQNEDVLSALTFTSWNDVMARFHTELAYRDASRRSTVCIILSSTGQELKRDVYINDTPIEEPVE